MRARTAAAMLAVLSCALTAPAEPSAAPTPRIVSLEECIALGFSHDAGLRADELEARIAEARVQEMQRQYVPSLSLQAGYSRLSDVAPGTITATAGPQVVTVTFPPSLLNSTSMRLALQQPVFTGRRIESSVRQAEAARDSSRGDLGKSRLDLRYSITEAYWSLARAKAQAAAIRQSMAPAESHLADAQKLLGQGMATTNDVLQARMRVQDIRIDLAGAATLQEISRTRLALLAGLSWNDGLDIPEGPAGAVIDVPRDSLTDLVSRALARRPELQSARSRVSAQEAAVDVARSGLFPSIFVTGDYTFADPNQRVFPPVDQFTGTWSIGILASLDVGRYPQYLAQEEQARGRLDQARESSRRLEDAVTADVIRSYLTLQEAAGRLASLREETVQAEENDRVTQERYRQGIALSSESLDAQTLVVRARLREQGALFDGLVARAALARAVGE